MHIVIWASLWYMIYHNISQSASYILSDSTFVKCTWAYLNIIVLSINFVKWMNPCWSDLGSANHLQFDRHFSVWNPSPVGCCIPMWPCDCWKEKRTFIRAARRILCTRTQVGREKPCPGCLYWSRCNTMKRAPPLPRRVFKDYFRRHSDLAWKPVSMPTSALETDFHAGKGRYADGNNL